MKTKIILLLLTLLPLSAFCQQEWLLACNDDIQAPETVYDKITIDKDACTITKNGKTFKLYGKVKIVESFPDLKVQVVTSFPDIKVKIDSWADDCGEFKVTDSWPDYTIQIVTSFPDLKVEMVENWPGF